MSKQMSQEARQKLLNLIAKKLPEVAPKIIENRESATKGA